VLAKLGLATGVCGLLIILGLWVTSSRGATAPGGEQPAYAAPLLTATPPPSSEPLPPGATVETVLSGLNPAIAMAFDPTGRIFYTEKAGAVRLISNRALQPTPVITFSVDTCSERGLLGIALDPQFSSNHYIYVYYTADSGTACGSTTNRVVRFVEANGVGSNPVEIFNSPQQAGNHNGGNIHFGPDGKLYISIGDNANAVNAQDVTVKNGKMHRINPDGSIPPGNPVFTQTGALPSLFAMGLRNSFDFTFDPVGNFIFASENGPGCDDEMNRIVGGYNYGWRDPYPCDDPNPDPTYNTIHPLWYVPNGSCCIAPTGIELYRGTSVPAWTNGLFQCNYNTGTLIHFYLSGDRTQVLAAPVVSGVTCNMDIATGTDGAFYYFEGGGYTATTLRRIVGGGPTATPIPTSTPIPPTNTPGGPTSTPPPCALSFSDVHPADYFYTPVGYLACHGVVSGYADGSFRPYNNTTRAQMVKIVVLGFGLAGQAPPSYTFADVPPGNPFFNVIETAVANSIITGYACGGPGETCDQQRRPYFRPNAAVTRGQLAKIVVGAAGWALTTPPAGSFADVDPGSPFYSFVETAACRGVISGYSCGGPGEGCDAQRRPYFRPGGSATRGQIAKIVYGALTDAPPCALVSAAAENGPGALADGRHAHLVCELP
jgi:glucose/arabinose dehydrogenase